MNISVAKATLESLECPSVCLSIHLSVCHQNPSHILKSIISLHLAINLTTILITLTTIIICACYLFSCMCRIDLQTSNLRQHWLGGGGGVVCSSRVLVIMCRSECSGAGSGLVVCMVSCKHWSTQDRRVTL